MPRVPRKIRIGIVLPVALVATHALADEQVQCAKFELKQAWNCEALIATVDLSACADEATSSPKVRCEKNAEVRVNGKEATYIATLHKEEGAWGAASWDIAEVRRTKRRTQKTAQVQVHDKALADRSPAGNVPLPNTPLNPVPPAPAVAPPSGIQFSGYFDAYIAHNFNRPSTSVPAGGSSLALPQMSMRYYDWTSDQLTLNLAELTIKRQTKEVAVLIDLDFGNQADINAQALTTTTRAAGGPQPGLVDEISKHIGQAFITYTPTSAQGLVVEVGKMYTHVGLELVKARDNWNYSRAYTFGFGGPFWHVGTHVGYAVVPSRLSASVYLYNGWNTIYAVNPSPTYGGQLKWTPAENLTLVYNYIGGTEQPGNNSNWRQVHEANLTVVTSPTFSFAADLLVGSETGVTVASGSVVDARWTGLELAAKWQVASQFSLAPRFEFYSDPQGYTLGGEGQNVSSFTLTPAYQVSDGLEARFELRHDQSSSSSRFEGEGGATAGQSTVTFGVLYSF